jgi:DNA-binding NtrC family response regulator
LEFFKPGRDAGNMHNELLVIEDTDVHLSILRKIAVQTGFATTGVNSVEGAATLLRKRAFDCITLDLNLGEESGNEVLQLLSELKCRTPVLIISGSDDRTRDVSSRAGKILGLNVYPPFPKPVDLAALRQTLKQIGADIDRQRLIRAGVR